MWSRRQRRLLRTAVRKLLEAEYSDMHTLRMLRHDPAGRAEHIRDNLHEMAETRYFVCEGDRDGRESAYQNLKHDFQYIVFLQLKPDKDLRKRRQSSFSTIFSICWRRWQRRRSEPDQIYPGGGRP